MKETASRAGPKPRQTIWPSGLKKGDTIGLVAPAGSIINENNFKSGLALLEAKGFRLKYNRRLLKARGYFAGSDRERADEFNRLWSDPDVKALVAARGGYGSMRLVDLIDMDRVGKNPKIFIGFSDLSMLLAALSLKAGLVTFHGPVVTTLNSIDRRSLASFFRVLMVNDPWPETIAAGFEALQAGSARGLLFGGNLTTLVHTIGTPYEIPWRRTILFIEDTDEAPYRLDRMLTHLWQAGRLQQIKGLILGTFTDEKKMEVSAMRKTVQKRVLELLAGCAIPIWTNLPVGHGRRNITLPVGAEVEMEAEGHLLKFAPPAAEQSHRKKPLTN